MERKLVYKTTQLKKAVKDFNKSIQIDTSGLSEEIIDAINSGQIQKFEIVVDLLWKTFKVFLFEVNGIDAYSPKQTIKEYFKIGECTYEDYEWMIKMVEMRNKLSHIYNEEKFKQIHSQITEAAEIINRVVANLT